MALEMSLDRAVPKGTALLGFLIRFFGGGGGISADGDADAVHLAGLN